jgi:hypothetical protein
MVDGEQAFGSGDDPPVPAGALATAVEAEVPFEKMHKPISPEMKKLGAESHGWARRMRCISGGHGEWRSR